MAFAAVGWFLSVTLIDTGLGTTVKTYELTSADAAAAATDAAAVITALTAVTDCEILEYHWYEKWEEQSVAIPAGVQKENQALLSFRILGEPLKKASHSIPGPKQSIFIATTGANADVLDLADTDVIAYRSLFQTGNQCFISDGEVADVLEKGHRRHVKNSRG